MPKKLLSVGFRFPGDLVEMVHYSSDRSILDADIIVIKPNIGAYLRDYQPDSFVREVESYVSKSESLEHDTDHWRREIRTALGVGKSIFVFLAEFQRAYHALHHSDERYPYSLTNFNFLPQNIGIIVGRRVTEYRPTREGGPFAQFWSDIAEYLAPTVYLEDSPLDPLLVTKIANKVLAGLSRESGGNLIVLPPINYPDDFDYNANSFLQYDEKSQDEYWTAEGIAFGKRLIDHIVAIDRYLRDDQSVLPPPEWSLASGYDLPDETALRLEAGELHATIITLQAQRGEVAKRLDRAGLLRHLLYATGLPLEEAILEALVLLGYAAESYQDKDLQFDAVSVSPEGQRLLGEAEGKDNRAINVDKISQLIRNLADDLQRDEVTEPAKGILFGNAFRLSPPNERAAVFTEKCVKTATANNIALVSTPDLFPIARYLRESSDANYARSCRDALGSAVGVVEFPPLPKILYQD